MAVARKMWEESSVRPAGSPASLTSSTPVSQHPMSVGIMNLIGFSRRRWCPGDASRSLPHGHPPRRLCNIVGWHNRRLRPLLADPLRKISRKRLIIVLRLVANHIPKRCCHLRCCDCSQMLRGGRELSNHNWGFDARGCSRVQRNRRRRGVPG